MIVSVMAVAGMIGPLGPGLDSLGRRRSEFPNNLVSKKPGDPFERESFWENGGTWYFFKAGRSDVRYQLTLNSYGRNLSACKVSRGRATKLWTVRLVSAKAKSASHASLGGLGSFIRLADIDLASADRRKTADLAGWKKGFAYYCFSVPPQRLEYGFIFSSGKVVKGESIMGDLEPENKWPRITFPYPLTDQELTILKHSRTSK